MNNFAKRPSLQPGVILASLFTVFLPVAALAAPPPSAGAILQQATPAPALPTAPGQKITIAPPAQQNLPPTINLHIKSVAIQGNHLIPTAKLQNLMQPVVGKTVSLATLDQTVARITAAYQAAGYPVAYAYLPPQRIASGIVHVTVVEPRFDQIIVAGHSRLHQTMVRRTAGLMPGHPVAAAPLNRAMILLNQTPGVHVDGVLLPGAQPGTTSLRLTPQDTPLITGSLTETDYGYRNTGSYLTNVTVSVNDPFGYGSSLSANALTSFTGRFGSGGFSATSPYLWDGVRLNLYASNTVYRLGDHFVALEQLGRATLLGADVTAPILLAPTHSLIFRFDVLDNWLSTSTRSVGTASEQTIPMERFSLSGAYQDPFAGITSAALSVSHGNLNLSPAAAQAIDAAGPRAAGSFWVSQLQLQRSQALPQGLTLTANFSGQIASRNLDSSQQFYIGGPYGVMSYPVGDGGGDDGYLFTAKLSHPINLPRLPGALSGALLAQTGSVWINHTPYAGGAGKNKLTESGVGVELDYAVAHWTLNAAFATQLGANSSPLVTTRRNQAWFSVSYAF